MSWNGRVGHFEENVEGRHEGLLNPTINGCVVLVIKVSSHESATFREGCGHFRERVARLATRQGRLYFSVSGDFIGSLITWSLELRHPQVPLRQKRRVQDGACPFQGLYAGAVQTLCTGYSKLRTRTALGSYGSSMPRSIGPSFWWCHTGSCVSTFLTGVNRN